MKKIILILMFSVIVHAGRAFQWSEAFMLKDPQYTTPLDLGKNGFVGQFDLNARPNPFNSSIVFSVSGIVPNKTHLGIYRIDGKLVADISASVHLGYSSIVWNASDLPAGFLFAKLQNGDKTKIIRFFRTR